MMRSLLVAGVLLVGAATVASRAQAPNLNLPPDADTTRYSYHRNGDNAFVRLDLRTGQVSNCTRGTSGWACLATPDDRAALEAEIGRLQTENAVLKKALLDRGLALPGGPRTDPPTARAPAPGAKAPSDADIDRVMSLFERIWRRLIEMMANIQRDLNKT